VPTEQCLGLDEEKPPASARKEPTRPGEKRQVTGPQRWASHPTTQDCHLVAKHDDFDAQLAIVTPKEPDQPENPDEREVQKGQRTSPSLVTKPIPTKVQVNPPG
jgi:hypothetical protein